MTPEMFLDISPYRSHIQSALVHAGDTHSVDDVGAMIAAGHAQLWPGPASLLVSEIVEFPRHKALHFFLAGGRMAEVLALSDIAIDWGRREGCSRFTLAGRKGWARVLASRGWTVSPLVLMERTDVR
jgi:hypothetical protein